MIVFGFGFIVNAQTNYTGRYGYSKNYPELPKDETGPFGTLIFLKTDYSQYKFWLFVSIGYPSYNSGELEGNLKIQNDSAVYIAEGNSCRIVFHFRKNGILIQQNEGYWSDFGINVFVRGNYPKINSKIPTAKDIVRYSARSMDLFVVSSKKAIIYKDEKTSEAKDQHFIKGDLVYASDDSQEVIFTKFITKSGIYVEGWLKKSDLKWQSFY